MKVYEWTAHEGGGGRWEPVTRVLTEEDLMNCKMLDAAAVDSPVPAGENHKGWARRGAILGIGIVLDDDYYLDLEIG